MTTELTNKGLLAELEQRPSVRDLLNGIKIQERLDKVLVILLDCSGSMSAQMDGQRKLDISWQVFKSELMPNMAGWTYGVVKFEDDAYWEVLPSQDIQALLSKGTPRLGGSTAMGKGLTIAWNWVKQNAKQARFIMLTDGLPTDIPKQDILELARKSSSIPIDTVGIGSGTFSYDPIFLAELSSVTGGLFVEVGTVKLLADTIKRLSPAERPLLGPVKET